MKDNFKTKVDYLNSTNKVNWILALFALISAIPGGIRLVRFIMDSFDNIIEPSNLFVGMLHCGGAFAECCCGELVLMAQICIYYICIGVNCSCG